MRIIFFGTSEISATILHMLMEKHDIAAVYTRPDSVRGRGNTLMPTPVKALCEDAGLPVFTPKTLKDPETIEHINSLAPDAICVVSYGALVPPAILEIPRYGCLNVHTSLLPRWRGAAPIERAILAGDTETGVCIMKMDEGLDTGAYVASDHLMIDHLCSQDLERELAICGGRLLCSVLDDLTCGNVEWVEQTEEDALYANKIEPHELYIDEQDSAQTIERKVRASSLAHPSKATIANRRVTLEEVALVEDEELITGCKELDRGQALFVRKRLILATSDGFIEVIRLRPDGKQSMDAQAFCAGIPHAKAQPFMWGGLE